MANELTEAYASVFSTDLNVFLLRLFVALGLILIGIFLGKIIAYALKKLFNKIDIEKSTRKSFINLIINVIKWSIYIVFINLALIQLPVQGLTEIITRILVVIPALVAALILISIGFAIAVYLRELVEDSEVTGWKILSQYLFYFVLYVSGVYSLKIALVSLDNFISNIIVIVLTAIIGIFIGYASIKKKI